MIKYADRVFISVNGKRLLDVQSATLRHNKNAKAVNSMTPDGFNRGFVQGNHEIDINVVVAVQNQLARPKLENIDMELNDVQLTWVCGAEQFVCTGLFVKDTEDNAAGVGDEVKVTYQMGALKVQDAVGNSSLFDLNFAA